MTADTLEKTTGTVWARRLAALSIGPTRTFDGLTLYPLIGARDGLLDYQTLDDALKAGTLTIREVGDSGTVPELALTNSGPRRVLIVDGEELIGAKQNRIVNTSVLVEAGAALNLPVSCVEAGRWRADFDEFRSAGTHYNARGRQKKVTEVSAALASQQRPKADQERVWSDVHALLINFEIGSETQALHAATETLRPDLDQFGHALDTPQVREIGAVFALGPDIVGLDLFDQDTTLAALLPKLIRSYALDALEEQPTAVPPPNAAVGQWLTELQSATGAMCPGVGLGDDIRLSAPGISGAALVYDGTITHLSAFRTASASGSVSTRMARASVRQRRA